MTVVTSNKKKTGNGGTSLNVFWIFFPNLVSRPDFKIIELSNYQIYYQNLARKLQLMHVYRKCMNNVLHLHLSCHTLCEKLFQKLYTGMSSLL